MGHYTRLTTLKNQVNPDKYARISWAGVDMWEEYNAFIINNKGSLKFYNGPSFSNSYTKPQFETASSRLAGVTFNTQQIAFTIAVYAVTEEQYRKLIYHLNPYTIDNLIFHFDTKWRYLVKLSKITDSSRYYLGQENGKDIFYTELQLTFEVQGDSIAQTVDELGYTINNNYYASINTPVQVNRCEIAFSNVTNASTDLSTPFNLTFGFLAPHNAKNITLSLVAKANTDNEITLFSMSLSNYPLDTTNDRLLYIFMYDSQTGNVFIKRGNEYQVLTLLTTNNSGLRIVDSLISNSYLLPGDFDNSSIRDLKLILSNSPNTENAIDFTPTSGYGLKAYGRTTLI